MRRIIKHKHKTPLWVMVRLRDGVTLYFDPTEVVQCCPIGHTEAQQPVYRLFYKDGTAEDMIDAWSVIPTA